MLSTNLKPADAIRAALKAKGISRKQVSVRHDHYSMGSTIRILVRDPAVRLSTVKEIANAFREVRYDSYSGEILSGGNRFVDVDYTGEALGALTAELAPVLATVKPDGVMVEIRGGEFRAFRTAEEPDRMSIWTRAGEGGRPLVHCHCYDGIEGATFAARQLAEYIADRPA